MIYGMLSVEPIALGEIAKKIGLNCKTARGVLTCLAATGRDVRCKASGRIHVFWREGA
jgi:predicted ArsR family transcriptional regulator